MSTRIVMRRRPNERIELYVDRCPLFVTPNTPEYRNAIAEGFSISMHADGVEQQIKQ